MGAVSSSVMAQDLDVDVTVLMDMCWETMDDSVSPTVEMLQDYLH